MSDLSYKELKNLIYEIKNEIQDLYTLTMSLPEQSISNIDIELAITHDDALSEINERLGDLLCDIKIVGI